MSSPAEKLIVSVDGGASHSRFGLFDTQGQLLFSTTDGPASLSLPGNIARNSIVSGLCKLRNHLGQDAGWLPDELIMGLAGSRSMSKVQALRDALPADLNMQIVTDGIAQLLGVTGGNTGVCLAVGTGSVAHWQCKDGSRHSAGGWGFPSGDEGSGSWIGVECIKAYCQWLDRCRRNTESCEAVPMIEELKAQLGEGDVLQEWTTCKNPTQLATLAKMVARHAGNLDPIATDILDRGAAHCRSLILQAPPDLPVYLTGGLADTYSDRLRGYFGERMQPAVSTALHGLLRLSELMSQDVKSA